MAHYYASIINAYQTASIMVVITGLVQVDSQINCGISVSSILHLPGKKFH